MSDQPLTHPPGRHEQLRRAEQRKRREHWRIILHNGVDLVTECDAFARFLQAEGRVRLAVLE